MAERADEPEFAWYRLQGREIAVLLALGALLAGLSAWAWLHDSGFQQPAVESRELPPARVNVNSATVAELTALPGIGERKAEKIVAARAATPIRSLQELAAAAGGIPAKDLERMRPYVVFE
ncbi:MAG: helix-hairpin-helix domain-containing protein [Planctomycetes bacterium]|nr:helix-hairpin-helix domain-containing protein [Planctomycetota bacterium]